MVTFRIDPVSVSRHSCCRAVHFPLSGVISLVTDLGEGEVVEAATVGFEGVSGISVFLRVGAPTERATVQVTGRAVTLSADAFIRAAAVADGPLYAQMRRYVHRIEAQLDALTEFYQRQPPSPNDDDTPGNERQRR